jgi:NodT family efflux transporter outer membrane factor (OMF) lipoprotein
MGVANLNQIRPGWLIGSLAIALTMSGCALGPKGIAPTMPQPAHYGVEETSSEIGAAGSVQHFKMGERPVPTWWDAYHSEQLSAWVTEALQHNYSLSQASNNLAAAREQLRAQVGSTLYPSVDAVAQSERQRSLGLPTFGPQTNLYNVYSAELTASYTFDLFGVASYANSALAAQVDAQSYQLDAARRALASNLVIAAVNSAALRAEVDSTEQLIRLADADAAEMKKRFDFGSASHGDLLNTEANAQALRASLPGLLTQWHSTRHALAVLMGRTPDAAPPDLELSALTLPENIPVSIPSDLLRQRPDILAADAALKVAAAQEALATAEMYPSLSITASFGHAGYTVPTAESGTGAIWGIGTSLLQPIFHGGALSARRDAAHDSFLAAEDNYHLTVLNAFQNVADSLGALTHDADTLTAATNQRRYSEQNWRDSERRVALGALPLTAARAEEKQFQNAKLAELRAMSARLADTAVLFQAMGLAESERR